MRSCKTCGSSVTERFALVFGDNDNEVAQCLHCSTWAEIGGGSLIH